MNSSTLSSLSDDSNRGVACFGDQEDENEDLFFDSQEDILSEFHSCPGSPIKNGSFLEDLLTSWSATSSCFKLCSSNLDGVRDRRDRFMKWMGINDMAIQGSNLDELVQANEEIQLDTRRIMPDSVAVLRGSDGENNKVEMSASCNEGVEENLVSEIKNLENGLVSSMDDLVSNDSLRSLSEVDSNSSLAYDELDRSLDSSSFIQHIMTQEDSASRSWNDSLRRKKIGWLRRLGAIACVVDRQSEESSSSLSDSNRSGRISSSRVKVRTSNKQLKELSAVYKGQDIKAHDGEIWTMKFSPDGQFLASGGADGIVRVWRVIESERNEISIPDDDPSCIYFSMDPNAEVTILHADELKSSKLSTRKTAESTCVVIPPNVFQLCKEPVHQFHGHGADILDLSWSSDMHLLSSSKDKTVRLWRVGSDNCLKIFSHANYVTCLQYNPINEQYFVSGSIDGKVRTWDISKCRVVDWVDIREIITAICYRPNGKGVVVGTLTGNCRFYDASDNNLQIEAQISLHGKKKPPFRSITGFQFCPTNPQELMVTCSDSHIRIFYGIDIVAKYKGFHNPRSLISASFTEDGQHIISASDDNNVFIWSHAGLNASISDHVKSIWASERFFSPNASIAIPWHGLKSDNKASATSDDFHSQQVCTGQAGSAKDDSDHLKDSHGNKCGNPLPFSGCMSQKFSEFLPKGSATWPEEKLPPNVAASDLYKYHYKLLKKTCQNRSHAWGQVLLTAGWDGWISRLVSLTNDHIGTLPFGGTRVYIIYPGKDDVALKGSHARSSMGPHSVNFGGRGPKQQSADPGRPEKFDPFRMCKCS